MKWSQRIVVLGSFLAWSTTLVAIGLLSFAWLLPQDLTDRERVYSWLVVVSFFGRVFTYHAGLALMVVAGVALLARRWRLLATAAVAATLCVLPTLGTYWHRQPPMPAAPAIRVMSINLLFTNTQYDSILSQIQHVNPDVVVMEEFTTTMRDNLEPALAERFPHRCLRPAPGGHGLALLSRLPFTEPTQFDVSRRRAWIRAAVRLGDRPVAVFAVHPHAPLGRWAIMENRQEVAEHLRRFADEPLPIIAAGDWNFTAETSNAHAITSAGFRDAFDLAAHGRGATWPINSGWKSRFPGVRIDHVYLSPSLTCTRYQTGTYDGSDHLPIVADVVAR